MAKNVQGVFEFELLDLGGLGLIDNGGDWVGNLDKIIVFLNNDKPILKARRHVIPQTTY